MFTLQQNSVAQKHRDQDQRQSDERSMRTTFENSIQEISSLLLNRKFNRTDPEHLLHIRVKTLTTLRYVDAVRSRDIIQFLYESRLLRTNLPKEVRLTLNGADLSNVEFVGLGSRVLDLRYLNLAGVDAPNIVFTRCDLQEAKFSSLRMNNATFRSIYATDMTMTDIPFYGNDFRNSILHRIRLNRIDVFGTIDLTNADWYGDSTHLDSRTLTILLLHPSIIRTNARLPDGNYPSINERNLIEDGQVEQTVRKKSFLFFISTDFCQCFNDQNSTHWLSIDDLPSMTIFSTENLPDFVEKETLNRCSFVSRVLNVSISYQMIDVHLFSVLIDNHHAALNLSGRVGCHGSENNFILLVITFVRDSLLGIDDFISKIAFGLLFSIDSFRFSSFIRLRRSQYNRNTTSMEFNDQKNSSGNTIDSIYDRSVYSRSRWTLSR